MELDQGGSLVFARSGTARSNELVQDEAAAASGGSDVQGFTLPPSREGRKEAGPRSVIVACVWVPSRVFETVLVRRGVAKEANGWWCYPYMYFGTLGGHATNTSFSLRRSGSYLLPSVG